jgi:hypothetical protein
VSWLEFLAPNPGAVTIDGIGARGEVGGHAIMQMAPVIRRCVARVDVHVFDLIYRFEHALDARPTRNPQEDSAPGLDPGKRYFMSAEPCGDDDVDARHDGAMIVRGPADEGEGRTSGERNNPGPTIDDLILHCAAEPDPLFDPALDP